MHPTAATLSAPQFAAALRKINACSDAREWAKGMDYDTAWNTCQNPHWLLFLLDAVAALSAINNELLVCAFAREVVHLTTDPRVLACILTREAWAAGVATNEERAAARDAAWSAARDAAWSAARDAAWSAAWSAARAAARDAAWDADWSAAGDAAKAKQCAIIRELIPQPLLK